LNNEAVNNVKAMDETQIRLLESAQGGDMRAFAELFEAMRPALTRVAAGLVGESDAEDVVMNALLKLWKALPAFRGQAALRTWVIRVVRNTGLDHLRGRARRREVPLELEGDDGEASRSMDLPDPTTVHPGETMDAEGDRGVITEALARIEPAHRRVLELRFLDELSYKEIAAATGVTIGTVMSRIFYAKRKLAKLLPEGLPH